LLSLLFTTITGLLVCYDLAGSTTQPSGAQTAELNWDYRTAPLTKNSIVLGGATDVQSVAATTAAKHQQQQDQQHRSFSPQHSPPLPPVATTTPLTAAATTDVIAAAAPLPRPPPQQASKEVAVSTAVSVRLPEEYKRPPPVPSSPKKISKRIQEFLPEFQVYSLCTLKKRYILSCVLLHQSPSCFQV
jgi:hypothetical protein